ncbi:MAG: tRNA (adenosine(37)-N6)-dimethylallyltransferase MiaA [Marinilabiliaceae bacterium]|nr:tRNA (adenosine(37)-N6)-dimethylallyltransferase MiaA [Marinilabiliaceae bacterium]
MQNNYLIVIVGPTGIGKTDLSIKLAENFNTEIISGDSRQIFKEMNIGTATPTPDQLNSVTHHLINSHSITDYYNAYKYEQDVLKLTSKLFETKNPIILTGGSMMYIDALCNGIDELPTIDPKLRDNLKNQFDKEGITPIRRLLKQLDPAFYSQVDLKNPKRIIHAVEVCLMTGLPYSNLRKKCKQTRPFKIIKIGLEMNRDELYSRINKRVDLMIEDGLENEAIKLFPLKHLNSLNTVGYKELFEYFDGKIIREEAIELIKRNSRRYAKKQLSWFKKDNETTWFNPNDYDKIINFVNHQIESIERSANI